MHKSVCFRPFEERDIDFIYQCKNDEALNSMIVGEFHKFSYEEATNWVHGCMGEHDNFKFWAICTNDAEHKIIGWVSISNINPKDKSVCHHGIVIANRDYNDGFAWIETYLFIREYVFEVMGYDKLYGSYLVGHKESGFIPALLFSQTESIQKDAVFKNGRYYDKATTYIMKEDYLQHKQDGDYEMKSILRRVRELRKQ